MMNHCTSQKHAGVLRFGSLLVLLVLTCAGTGVLAQEKDSLAVQRDSAVAAAREIMGALQYCALVTIDSTGQPQIRTMNPFPPEKDMTVWMATNSRSKKVREIRNNPKVCLYYADHSRATGFVALKGKAVLVDDMAEKLRRKRAYWDQAFPDWKYLILIKVIPEQMDVLNYRRGMLNDPGTFRVPSFNLTGY